ncbi:vomeronasal type-1 receptor 4-like [Sciurus carolinensis]|uniref:vomeronasal type-1 receptor 4-like n=1 Tax=Sciurus carolinensis TaxID=30640 RepID=UPI001FB49C62|nr:vomeronasal type-1 receptor 4-like [Sciurus carolinensis]
MVSGLVQQASPQAAPCLELEKRFYSIITFQITFYTVLANSCKFFLPVQAFRTLRLGQEGTGRTAASDVAVGIIFLSQIVVGVLGNSFLLLRYLVLYFTGHRVKPTDLILKHLIVANLLTLLCRGVPQTIEAFSLEFSLGDIECKLLSYVHRVGRCMSIGSTSLLSIFQAITIGPRDSSCSELKVKALRNIGTTLHLSCILYMLITIIILMYMTGKWKNTTMTTLKDFGYCSSFHHDTTTVTLFAALLLFPDAVCVGLMLWASSSMVLTLHRHKQRMQHIQKTISPRFSPESRATKTILLLVSTFVSFYTLSCISQVCLTVIYNPNWFLLNRAAIVSGCFPAVSPLLLMSRDSRASRFCFSWIENRKSPVLMMNM